MGLLQILGDNNMVFVTSDENWKKAGNQGIIGTQDDSVAMVFSDDHLRDGRHGSLGDMSFFTNGQAVTVVGEWHVSPGATTIGVYSRGPLNEQRLFRWATIREAIQLCGDELAIVQKSKTRAQGVRNMITDPWFVDKNPEDDGML